MGHQQQRQQISGPGAIRMHRDRFAHLACESLKRVENNQEELICIAHFQFRQNSYHLEKLLPVWLPEQRTFVALCFEFNPKTGSRVSGIGLDLTDMKNKATLINTVPANSWLNPSSNEMVINNLDLVNGHSPRKQHNNRNHKKNNNNNRGGPCDDSQMQQPQWNDSNSMDSFSTFNNNFSMTPAMTPAPPSMSQRQTPTMTPVITPVTASPIPSFPNISYPQSMPSTPNMNPLPTPSVPMNIQLLSVQTAQYQAEAQYFQQ